ncbi:hypothetical protein ACFU8Q_38310 [Streptomyces sp. NPDC057543]|uniref:AbiTii domain-containing protein n=1 Tax=Streptomyces sp. NPDC057543 TaxID=3346163 RepID=UPI0036C3CE09
MDDRHGAGPAFSEPLRTWAMHELRGYNGPLEELPSYRTIAAPLQVDARSAFWEARGETISALDLPEVARNLVTEELPIRFSVSKIQTLVAEQDPHEPLKLSLPGAAELARMMTYEQQHRGVVVETVYWAAHVSALHDVLEQMRNRMLEFVAELRSAMAPGKQEPTVEQVHRAAQNIHITVGDHSPVTLTAPLSYERQSATVGIPSIPRYRWWPRRWSWRRPIPSASRSPTAAPPALASTTLPVSADCPPTIPA